MNHQALPRYVTIGFVIVALFFVIAGYDRGLPISEFDEGNLLSQTIFDRGVTDFTLLPLSGYPPVILALFTGTQMVTESIRHQPVLYHAELVIRIVRILAILANVTTVFIIIRIGQKLGYPLVGLVSAAIWAVLPVVNEHAALALTEPFQIMFITLAAWLMLRTIETRQMVWALLSTLSGLVAVCSKYTAFPALGFSVGASVYLLLVDSRRRYWSRVLFLQALLIGITAYWLVFVYGVNNLLTEGHYETKEFAQGGWTNVFDLSVVIRIFSAAATQVSFHLVLLAAILIVGLILMFRKSDRSTRVVTVYLLIFAVSYIWFIPAYIVYDGLKFRYLTPVTSILVLLICFAVWQLGALLAQQIRRPNAAPAAFLLMSFIWAAPSISTRLQELRALQFPDTKESLVQWAGRSIDPDDSLAILSLNPPSTWSWLAFHPIYGGYTGPAPELVDIKLYLQQPKSAWIDAGVDYVHLSGNYPGDYPPMPFDLDEMLLVKTFPNSADSSEWRGEARYIYRLQRYQNETDVRFADTIRLRGYDLSANTILPGDEIAIRTFWQADEPPGADYQQYIHLSSMDVHDALAQTDGTPSLPTRMTSNWTDPEETIVGAECHLTIPPDLPAGTYRLLVGLYDLNTGQRLNADDGEQYFMLATITVSD